MLRVAQLVVAYVVGVVAICEDGSCDEVPIDLLQSKLNVEADSSGNDECPATDMNCHELS